MNIEDKLIYSAARIAEDLLDEYGDSKLALTASIAVLAMIGRKVYPNKKHYKAFVSTVITSLMTAPKGSPL
jgi:hypothetical protein